MSLDTSVLHLQDFLKYNKCILLVWYIQLWMKASGDKLNLNISGSSIISGSYGIQYALVIENVMP